MRGTVACRPAMAALGDVLDHLDALLDPAAFADYCPNGLQVPGTRDVRRVVSGVSAHEELLRAARDLDADLVLAHHGLFWDGDPRALTPPMARKLGLLLGSGMALAAYHLPLDAHMEHGNNALLAGALGLVDLEPFALHGGRPLGVRGRFADPPDHAGLRERVRAACGGRPPLVFPEGPEPVRTLGVVSGSAPDDVHAAIALGLDAFLTGEPAERVMAVARENAITFMAAGHYATETRGVQRLGELLAERFGVEHRFVDVPNPI